MGRVWSLVSSVRVWAAAEAPPSTHRERARRAAGRLLFEPSERLLFLSCARVILSECASSSSGAEDHRKEERHDVTERQAHGSQPV